MSRHVQLLSLVLSSARALSARSTLTSARGRFMSKGPHMQPWPGGRRAPVNRDVMCPEEELEDVDDKIQRVIDGEVKQQKRVKYHMIRRKMTPHGPPERRLTWEAIETIRYLKQEQPEEWTVDRLAEGFSVSKDDILRVLRSKFVPSSERKAKQDIQVMLKLKHKALPSRAGVEKEKQRLSSGGSAVVPVIQQNVMLQTELNSPAALSVLTKKPLPQITEHQTNVTLEEGCHTESSTEAEEDWDGQVLSEDDIEKLLMVKSTPVVKRGNEFFDEDGNFLYKI